MGRYCSVPQGSNIVGHKMILSLVSSVLFATLALGAPGASNYGGAAVVGPAKQIASPSIQCRTEYVTLWDTEYQEKEEQICETVYEKQCSTVYKNVCVQKFRTDYEPYTESECTTEYKQDCQYEWRGHGNDKVWAPIEGTCQNVPYDECKEVAKSHSKQVAYQECNDVPEQKCVSVPRQVCITVPDQVCTSEPLTECQGVPRQSCHSEHKRFPVRVSRQAPKKVCNEVHAPQVAAAQAVHQAAPSVQDLLNYGVPAVPTQVLPEIILARDKQKLQNAANDDRIVFG